MKNFLAEDFHTPEIFRASIHVSRFNSLCPVRDASFLLSLERAEQSVRRILKKGRQVAVFMVR